MERILLWFVKFLVSSFMAGFYTAMIYAVVDLLWGHTVPWGTVWVAYFLFYFTVSLDLDDWEPQ